MSGYKYLKLNYLHDMIQIITADYITLDWLLEEIGKIAPTYKVCRGIDMTRIEELKGAEKKIGAWIIQILCQQGWEPYSGTGPLDGTVWHHLRYRNVTHEF